MTETSVGSDAASLKTTEAQSEGHWRVEGVKRFISNSKQADLCLLFAVTDKSLRHKVVSAFIADLIVSGFSV